MFTERACPLNATARLDRVPEGLVARNHYEPIRDVVTTLVARIRGTLRHLIDIGVGYLSLNRGVPTLSRGESQRVKMARQLNCDLVDLHLHPGRAGRGAASAEHRSEPLSPCHPPPEVRSRADSGRRA